MKLLISDKEYFLDFHHFIGPDFRRLHDLDPDSAKSLKGIIYDATGVYPSDTSEVLVTNGSTICRIYDNLDLYKSQGAVIAEAEAYCSPSDNFSRKLGRKVSFTKALEALQIPREERKEWWQAYGRLLPKDLS